MHPKPLIYDFDLDELTTLCRDWSEPDFRGVQIYQGLYRHLWGTPEEFTNLAKSFRQRLAEHLCFRHMLPVKTLISSSGNTEKTLFRTPNGMAVETVLMKYRRRRTLCISTQIGCAMGCVFCATGQMGFRRHLTSGEIVEQVLYYARRLKAIDEQVTNVVLMGMGEPLHNYTATMKAIDQLNHPQGFRLGARRFTISTVGLVPMIRRLANERRQINLAVSLHAADDELRSSLLPINHKYPLDELLAACRAYVEKTHRRITFEWALLHQVNDSPAQARRLASLIKGLLCQVNVIPLNPTEKYSGKGTTHKRALAFQEELQRHGIPCTIRLRRGIEIQAGCGQLAGESGDSC